MFFSLLVNLFNLAVESVDWEAWGKTVNAALYSVGKTLETITTNVHFGSLGKAFGDFVNGLVEDLETFQVWGNAIGAQLQGAFRMILSAALTIKWEQVGKAIWTLLKAGMSQINPTEIYLSILESFLLAL